MSGAVKTESAKRSHRTGAILAGSLLLLVALPFLPLGGLAYEAKQVLSITLFTVILWATGAIPPSFASLFLIAYLLLFELAPAQAIFRVWTTPTAWLVLGSFLLALAVEKSGLGKRLIRTLGRALGVGRSFLRFLACVYLLQFLLCLLIPQPFPRSLLLFSVFSPLVSAAAADRPARARLAFIIFSSSPPVSMLFFTGDVLLHSAVLTLAGQELSWLNWLYYFSVPGLLAVGLTFLLHLKFFPVRFSNKAVYEGEGDKYDQPFTGGEKRVLAWVGLAVLLWATDALHGIDPAAIAIFAAVGLSWPGLGGVLRGEDLNRVNWPILLFLTGATAIGAVSIETGLIDALAGAFDRQAFAALAPVSAALAVLGVSFLLHMVLSSVLATVSISIPFLAYLLQGSALSPLATALISYMAVSLLYFFPFQNAAILIGSQHYGPEQTVKFGFFSVLVLVAVFFSAMTWWKALGVY